MGQVLFFGYGANKSQQKVKEIIGKDPGEGIGAVLKGYTLNVQSLEQLPQPPREFLRKIYGNDFKSYTLKKGQGVVSGVVWEIEESDLEKIKEWEFVGSWREVVELEVLTSSEDNIKVFTEKSKDDYPTTFVVDGLTYNVFAFSKKNVTNTKDQQYYTNQQLTSIRKWLTKYSAKK